MVAMWALGIEPHLLEEQLGLLTAEPSLQPQDAGLTGGASRKPSTGVPGSCLPAVLAREEAVAPVHAEVQMLSLEASISSSV